MKNQEIIRRKKFCQIAREIRVSNVYLVVGYLLDGCWDKNDIKDAANIADLVSRGRCLYYDCPSPSIIEIRSLLSLRRRLKKEEHSLMI